jgi:hypothetical protein
MKMGHSHLKEMQMAEYQDDPVVVPYRSFPSFSEWSRIGYDDSLFQRYEEQLIAARDGVESELFSGVLERAMRWAAVDTGALESLYEVDRGFTFTVALGAAAWATIEQLKGPAVARAINDAMTAYEGVLDAATKATPITEAWIRGLHEVVCASQDSYTVITPHGPQERPLTKGAYKVDPNSPLNLARNEIHSYAPPSETGREMARLVAEFRGDDFDAAHPVLQASYAHYAFVAIHPFPDGNGRVARALSSVFLYRRPSVPLVIFVDQKPQYLDALELADGGSFTEFIDFVSDRVIETMALVRDEVLAAAEPSVTDRVAGIEGLLTGRGGQGHLAVDSSALKLLATFEKTLKRVSGEVASPSIAVAVAGRPSSGGKPPAGYRGVAGSQAVRITLTGPAPASIRLQKTYEIAVARPETIGPDIVVSSASHQIVDARMGDVEPAVSHSLSHRLETIARREVGLLVDRLTKAVRDNLRSKGYL